MRAWLEDLRALFTQLADLPRGRVVVVVEPTLWPQAQLAARRDQPSTVPVALSGSGDPVARGLPDDLRGLARAIVRLRDRTAPGVLLAYGTADWGGGVQVEESAVPDAEVVGDEGAEVATAVLIEAVDATAGDRTGLVVARGPAIVSKAALVFDASVDDAAKTAVKHAELSSAGIVPRDTA